MNLLFYFKAPAPWKTSGAAPARCTSIVIIEVPEACVFGSHATPGTVNKIPHFALHRDTID
jgi:hypothetical protein